MRPFCSSAENNFKGLVSVIVLPTNNFFLPMYARSSVQRAKVAMRETWMHVEV